MEISTLHGTLPLKTTAKAGLHKSVKSSPFCPSELGFTVLTNLQIRVQHTAWGMHITKTDEMSISCQGSWKPHSTLWFLGSTSTSRWFVSKGLDSSGKKNLQVVISTVSILLEKKKCNCPIQHKFWEKLLIRKDTGLHVKDTMCFC